MEETIIRDIRDARGLSLGDMAYKLDISPNYLYMIQNKKCKTPKWFYDKMVKYFDLSITERNLLKSYIEKQSPINNDYKAIKKEFMEVVSEIGKYIGRGDKENFERVIPRLGDVLNKFSEK